MTSKIVVIPQENYGLVVNISEANYIEELSKIDIPYESVSKVINNNQIVTLDKNNNQLLVHNLTGQLENTIDTKLEKSYTINARGSVVYIGGASQEKEKCFFIDISNKHLQIQALKLPKFMALDKAIDDIVFLDNKMYLVDNIVLPKYTFEYNISEPASPVLTRTINLDYYETWGDIKKAQVNEKWMVYLATSINGYTGRSSQIFTDNSEKKIYFKTYNLIKFDSEFYYKDIYLVDDTLYVLTLLGLGYFDLTSDELSSDDIVFIQHTIVADRIIPIDKKSLILLNKHSFELLDLENFETLTNDVIDKRRDRHRVESEKIFMARVKGPKKSRV